MKFLPLVWMGIWRKRSRALLILLQITIAFTLFGVLQGVNTAVNQSIARTRADHLFVYNSISRRLGLPLALAEQLQKVPGVESVNYRILFPMTYQTPEQFVAGNATQIDTLLRLEPDIKVSPEQLAAYEKNATAAIVGSSLARKYGWKIGDRVPLYCYITKADGSHDWAFDITGIYTRTNPDDAMGMYVHYGYVNEARAQDRNMVSMFALLIADPKAAARVSSTIDRGFANSPYETRTQTESELLQAQMKTIADIDFLAHSITAAAFFALLVATGALMMQSIRERTAELAALKTLGFSDGRVTVLVLAESLFSALVGAAAGMALAVYLLPKAKMFGSNFPKLPSVVWLYAFGCAALLALLSGAIPAWRSGQLKIADALARR